MCVYVLMEGACVDGCVRVCVLVEEGYACDKTG